MYQMLQSVQRVLFLKKYQVTNKKMESGHKNGENGKHEGVASGFYRSAS